MESGDLISKEKVEKNQIKVQILKMIISYNRYLVIYKKEEH